MAALLPNGRGVVCVALFEYLSMAFASIKSNKMRSLLTMLGIIIGIAAVIAIETVGNSLSSSVSDSMSGTGASSITVSLTQKSSSNSGSSSGGVRLRLFKNSSPDDKDLITDTMIEEFTETFPDKINYIEKTQQVGSATIGKVNEPDTTITATVSGVNQEALHTPMPPTLIWTATISTMPSPCWMIPAMPGAMSAWYPKNLCSRPSAAATLMRWARKSP